MTATTRPLRSSSLDTEELSVQPSPPQYFRTWLDHSLPPDAWRIANETVRRVLGDRSLVADRLAKCRTKASFVRHQTTGEVRVKTNACRNRWCPYCARARAYRIATNTAAFVRSSAHPSLLTLTLRLSSNPIRTVINRLIDGFRSLRKEALWSDNVTGGIWFVQIVPKPERSAWHVHLHIVMDSSYMAQKRLADAWERITIDSRIVDIRRIWSPDHAARYVSRYVARPIDLAVLSDVEQDDAVSSTAGLHLIGVFGNAQGKGVLTREAIDKAAWVYIADYRTIAELYQSDPDAQAVWQSWRTKSPLTFTPNFDEYERDLAGTVPSPSRSPPKPKETNLWNA